MSSISGVIDHAILCYKGRRYIFMLDNHDTDTYCMDSSNFIDDELTRLLPVANIYLEEPVFQAQREQAVLRHEVGYHIKKYVSFIRRHNNQYCPFDIRHTFPDDGIDGIRDAMAFNKSVINNSQQQRQLQALIKILLLRLESSEKKICEEHRAKLLALMMAAPVTQNEDEVSLDTLFPFNGKKEASGSVILDAAMEFFLILLLLASRRETNVIYCGAVHSIRVIAILTKFYNFEVIRPLHIDHQQQTISLSDLDMLNSCTDVPLYDTKCPLKP